MPDSTLCAHPWLAELGDSALGETLSDLSGVERSSYEYAWLPVEEAGDGARAARRRDQARRPLGAPLAGILAQRPAADARAFPARHGPRLRPPSVPLPRSGDELIQRIAERWRWFVYRVRFHPWTTHELPRILERLAGLRTPHALGSSDRHLAAALADACGRCGSAGRGKPNPHIFIIFVVGTVLMRSAGCAINDYADRSFDPHVARTKRSAPGGRAHLDARGPGAVRRAVA